VATPSGSVSNLNLFDDGLNGDALAGDLIYSARATGLTDLGAYGVAITGNTATTSRFVQTAFEIQSIPDLEIVGGSLSSTACLSRLEWSSMRLPM